MSAIKPVFLLADSQLLFRREEDGRPFLARAREAIDADAAGREPRAAYLGASNGDRPEFYELFVAAMAEVGVAGCRMIPARPEPDDLAFLDEADLILLAGGDVRRGWEAFTAAGVADRLVARYYGGALLIGVSAGAVQLGLKGFDDAEGADDTGGPFDTLRIVPFVVDVHDEPGWARLARLVPRAGEHVRGLGIPSGGGALYHPDASVEPVRHPVAEVTATAEGVRQALLFPGERADAGEEPGPDFPGLAELLAEAAPPGDDGSVN